MRCQATALAGVYLLEPHVFTDERGFFFESYSARTLRALGITNLFVQQNQARSVRHTLRGLHYQITQQQAKICRVLVGAALDVVVDIRQGSPTFGQWLSVCLSAENKQQLFIPKGCAHGYYVQSEVAEYLYQCDDYYAPEHERGILWNDADLGIDWQCDAPPMLSARDQRNPRLADVPARDFPRYGAPA